MNDDFGQLIDSYIEEPESSKHSLEKKIWSEYGVEKAVLIVDMSGFSSLTEKHGIVFYISMIRQMEKITMNLIDAFHGKLVKFEADNGFFVFPNVDDAIGYSLAIYHAFLEHNQKVSSASSIHISCGLDYGEILLVGGTDFYGKVINLASKLGEDIAHSGELIVTSRAFEQTEKYLNIPNNRHSHSISNIDIDAIHIDLDMPG